MQQQQLRNEALAAAKTVVVLTAFMGLMMCPSRDWTWPAPWLILACTCGLLLLPCSLYIHTFNPGLLQERQRFVSNPGTAPFERLLVPAVVGLIPVRFAAAGLQHMVQLQQQPGWSRMPLFSVPAAAALVLLVLACLLCTWSMCTNTWFSSVVRIQSDRGHAVCCTGPYAWVRHPGYVAFSLQSVAEAVLLESSWAMWCAVAKVVVLLVRTVYEDAFLQANLRGYASYAQRVKYRWLPLIW